MGEFAAARQASSFLGAYFPTEAVGAKSVHFVLQELQGEKDPFQR